MYPHRIRLLGPWDCEAIAPDQTVAASRFTPPGRLSDMGQTGRVRLVRRFGYPGRIDSYEHVWLTIADVGGGADISLNGHLLIAAFAGTCEFEVTPLLEARNRLEVAVDVHAGVLGEVALEIRRDAFLRAVAAHTGEDGTVRVTGQVIGTSARPLELYVLADGRNTAYTMIEGRPEGQPFEIFFQSEALAPEIRVELVHVAERWYAVEIAVAPA
jgi:hypothetical protein